MVVGNGFITDVRKSPLRRRLGTSAQLLGVKPAKNKPKTKNQYPAALRRRHWVQRFVELEKDFEDTKSKGWFNDTHITYLFENIEQSLAGTSEETQNFLFIKPIMIHWLNTKDSAGKDHAEKYLTLRSFELEKKNLIF